MMQKKTEHRADSQVMVILDKSKIIVKNNNEIVVVTKMKEIISCHLSMSK